MVLEPADERVRLAAEEHVDRRAPLKIHEHRRVPLPAPQREVIDPEHAWGGYRSQRQASDQAQERIWAGGQPRSPRQACPTLTARAQPQLGQQPRGAIGPAGAAAPYPFHHESGRPAFGCSATV
jgi:hypothetical protein